MSELRKLSRKERRALKRAQGKTWRMERPKRTGFLFWRRSHADAPPRGDRFEKFTERARKVFALAQEEAQRFNHNYIGTEHLLLGLVREEDGIAGQVLANLGVQLPKVRSAVEFIIGRGGGLVTGEPGLTPRAKKVIELSMDEARRLNNHYIGTEHLLLGLVREGEGIAAGVLESLGVSLATVRQQVMQIMVDPGYKGSSSPAVMPPAGRISHPFPRRVEAGQLLYGLTLPSETFTELTAIAQRLHRPVDDLIREAIAAHWLGDAASTGEAVHDAPPIDAEPETPREEPEDAGKV